MDHELLDWLEARASDHFNDRISAEHFLVATFMALQMHQFQKQFSSRATRFDPKPKWPLDRQKLLSETLNSDLLLAWLKQRHFLFVIANAQTAMTNVLTKQWKAKILFHIPTPIEVLRYQSEGLRVVTVLWKKDRVLLPVLEKKNALDFILHDLEHLYKFEFDPALKKQQIVFAKFIQQALEKGLFDHFLSDPEFQKKFDYLASDMNTHPVHGLKFMKAMYLEYFLRHRIDQSNQTLSLQEELIFDDHMKQLAVHWGWNKEAQNALIGLNKRELESNEMHQIMLSFT
ncbi:MAG: hypothetical protein Fur0010_24550 [Bdellovibrio sp.]